MNALLELRNYIREQARVADKNSKEWASESDAINSAYRNGMWYAYHDVENRLGLDCPSCAGDELNHSEFCPKKLIYENDALRDAIRALKDFVDGKRNDCENIAEILNGALIH